jgi:hypothetical protein
VRSAAVAALAVVVVSNGACCVEHCVAHKRPIALANCVREPAARCVVRGCMCVHVCSYVGAQRWGVSITPHLCVSVRPYGNGGISTFLEHFFDTKF